MRSRTGCLTCRNRKLKCDELKPTCSQCAKARRQCIPSPGVVFRHQQNASMNGDAGDGAQSNLKSFYGYKETFGKDSIWVDVPKELTFVHTSNPYEDSGSPEISRSTPLAVGHGDIPGHVPAWVPTTLPSVSPYMDFQSSTHGLEALSAAASGDHYLQQRLRQSVSVPASTHLTRHDDMNYVMSHQNSLSPPLDPQLHADAQNIARLPPSVTETDVESDDDVPFLLRYFSEGPGAWMDLFDINSFFAVDVPVKAASCPLLLFAAIALSAKALGRIRISAHYIKQSSSNRTPSQWSHKARYYYDLAIGHLRQALEHRARPRSTDSQSPYSPNGESGSSRPMDGVSMAFSRWRGQHGDSLPGTDSDELVATTAILCVYEFLDASGVEWSRHLEGAKSLFDIARDGAMPVTIQSPGPSAQLSASSKGRNAVFWNICRQEMLNAFINNKETRLDTADMSMWQSAGLHIGPSGYILPSNKPHLHVPMADDMIANALVWLTMKLVNFIAAGDDFPHELGLGIRQKQLLEYWESLEKQLDIWYEGLPDSFRPSSTVKPDTGQVERGEVVNIARKWYARPMCASTVQSYHFARIQLLANKPHLSTGLPHRRLNSEVPGVVSPSSLAQRHASYATILHQSRKHAEEIVSISLALTNDSARIHSVQPLYTAGQVLGSFDEAVVWEGGSSSRSLDGIRACVLDLLQGIQRETGWATEYRMTHLLEQWGLPESEGTTAANGLSAA